MFQSPTTWKRIYDISFYLYCLLALANLALLFFLTIRASDRDYETLNQWDVIYHGHNIGAHICTIVTIVNMWRPKGFVRSPILSILHFVPTEIVKLYFAIKWTQYWPNPDSAWWMVSTLAALNTTQPTDADYAKKIDLFDRFTEEYKIEWTPPTVAGLPPTAVYDGNLERFLTYVRVRTYNMTGKVLGMAIATTVVGAITCVIGYWYFVILKRPKKKETESPFRTDPVIDPLVTLET
jgi:hypothetical protein